MTKSNVDFDLNASGAQAGDKLGVWRLEQALAEVPSGRWWLAQHSLSHQGAWVVVYARPEDAAAVLLRIAQTEGQPWQHPDITWPLDSGLTSEGRPYVVFPLSEGEPLLLAVRQASLRRRLEWVVQLCELLLMAETAGFGLVELDPSLLWVGPQQQLRLMALALVRADAKAQRMGSLQGQLCHAAQAMACPEAQARAPGVASSGAAQVYAVGMVTCLLVNGRLPQQAEPANAPVQALSQWLALKPEAREALDELLRRATAADPKQRPADLGELAEAVEGWLDASAGMASTEAAALDAVQRKQRAEAPTMRMPLDEAKTMPPAEPPSSATLPPKRSAKTLPPPKQPSNRPSAGPAPAPVAEPEPPGRAALWWVGGAVVVAGLVLLVWLR
ncbi:hypothetical protein [Inhella proteolytica]|uniref:Protein kinase domain-containing protein n=1 Tax=Inhella proteolytica TaxID=2795029 RepID=A0A931NG02_9BURK|nr:hypothetical protein [Inhella proteolytica]MBH9576646.1 hypothetical protein [Inhella proteolytica]